MRGFPDKYKVLRKNLFESEIYTLIPIRYKDRFDIMQWRNEQIYHLRQSKPLKEADQEFYFQNVVSKLFEAKQPEQLLFSYLEHDTCIGYGGLVHINWTDRNAEISFIMATNLEKEYFHKHWKIYLGLLEKVAFKELSLHKIYTYAFDLRPHLYEAVEAVGYKKEAVLTEHCYFNGEFRDVVIHSKTNRHVAIRRALESDMRITYEWANDESTRKNSFSSEHIPLEVHKKWWASKLKDSKSIYFIGEVGCIPAGVVRFDKNAENGNFVIGINIAPKFRGQGLSYQFLREACREFFRMNGSRIEAYIKTENTSSIKSFEKAGFQFVRETEINGNKTLMYQLTQR